MKLRAVLTIASVRAPAPKAAVPPSVLQAYLRLMRMPQMNSATVKSRERVALQTFRTAEAAILMRAFSLIGTSCMTAATIASGPVKG